MDVLAKWTITDYHRMVTCGVLRDRRVELLRGDIVERSPESPLHYATTKRGSQYLATQLRGRADVRFNGPITLTDSEPEPAIVIARLPESSYFDRHPGPEDIYWVIEVAQTSLKRDRILKAGIYASAGIPEYWLLDLTSATLVVLRSPQAGQYTDESVFQDGEIVPLAFPDLSLAIAPLLQGRPTAPRNPPMLEGIG